MGVSETIRLIEGLDGDAALQFARWCVGQSRLLTGRQDIDVSLSVNPYVAAIATAEDMCRIFANSFRESIKTSGNVWPSDMAMSEAWDAGWSRARHMQLTWLDDFGRGYVARDHWEEKS